MFRRIFPKNRQLTLVLLAWAGSVLGDHAIAQTYTIVHHFAPSSPCCPITNSDGWDPNSLVLSGNALYGTTTWGSTNGSGTVFVVNTNGTGFNLLYTFSALPSGSCNCNNDGADPNSLLLSTNTLYGVTAIGGNGSGTVFAVNTDGTGFITVYNFTPYTVDSSGLQINSDGVSPNSLILSGSTLYGTAAAGGNNGGAIFSVSIDGSGFTTLYTFAVGGLTPQYAFTNTDGALPNSLVLSGGTLYGTTRKGCVSGSGEVFAINTDGTGFRILHTFTTYNSNTGVNADGYWPQSLITSGGALYGVTLRGAATGQGTVFSLNTDGTGFRTLHSFSGTNGNAPIVLVAGNNALYGTTLYGGVFALNTDGTAFHFYPVGAGASEPSLVWTGNTLYGTTANGGTQDPGVVFRLSLPVPPPQLTIASDNYGGFFINAQGPPNFSCQLQRAPNAAGPWTTSASQTADSSGLILFHDLFPPPGQAFYRTVQQ